MPKAFRAARRYWKLTAISAFSLTIAMALGVIGLSVSNTILIQPPSAPAPDRLVTIRGHSATEDIAQISYPDYQYFRDHNRVFTDIAAAPNSIGINVDFHLVGRELKVVTRSVSENYFAMLGIHPFLGRFFAPDDDKSQAKPAVMTWSCWKRLGADPHIVGKTLADHIIVGVTPKEFTGAFYGVNGDLFTTFQAADDIRPWFSDRDARRLVLTARLKPGVTRQQAQTEMAALSGQLASAYPKEDKGRTATVTRATLLPLEAISTAQWMAAVLMSLVLLVLLIACANVANLMLAAAVARRREAAIKLALGAERGRLIGEFLKESAVLCAVSGALGYGLAAAVTAHFSDFTMVFPMWGAFSFGVPLRLDGAVLAFTLLLIGGATLATGVAPALYASSPALAQVLGGEVAVGGTRKGVRRNALVVAQVAVCTLVLGGMGLCERNLYNLRHIDPGFRARNLVTVEIYLAAEGYSEAQGKPFLDTLRRTVSAVPGVESVTLAWDLPLLGMTPVPLQLPDGVKTISVGHTVVDTNYFATFEMPLLSGRGFDASDRENGPAVAVINHKLAEMFWPGKDPLGKTMMAGKPARQVTVVGVAADGKYLDIDEPLRPFIYYPLSQNYGAGINVAARTRGDPNLWVAPLTKALRGLGLKIMVQPVTFESWMDLGLLMDRIAAGAAGILSGLGLLLALIGLFGAISYSIGERKKELGIRIALGARPWQLLQMVLRQTALVTGLGIAIGALLGIGATIVFRSQLYGVGAVEWTVLLPVGAAMMAMSLAVAYVSARPWLAVDPMEAVRHA